MLEENNTMTKTHTSYDLQCWGNSELIELILQLEREPRLTKATTTFLKEVVNELLDSLDMDNMEAIRQCKQALKELSK